jgi:hypothetical protein
VAHDLHHHCQIAGLLEDGGSKCMACAVEHKRIGQASLLASFPKLLGDSCSMALLALAAGKSQPSDRPGHRSSNMSHIRSPIGTYRRAALVLPVGLKIRRFSNSMFSIRMRQNLTWPEAGVLDNHQNVIQWLLAYGEQKSAGVKGVTALRFIGKTILGAAINTFHSTAFPSTLRRVRRSRFT